MFDFRNWFGKTFRIDSRFSHCPERAPRRKTRLRLEQLEDRIVPTVVFEPQFNLGAVNPAPPNTSFTVLNNPEVYLIFGGRTGTIPAYRVRNRNRVCNRNRT